MFVPLGQMGSQTRLKLAAPRAAVSELTLVVPQAAAVGQV